ncbi:MAG TPA: hypothetical protein VNS32_20085, partial [Flavisolibacter sp.]|nr:hypothetical protein [Flavisolibacter sp.]
MRNIFFIFFFFFSIIVLEARDTIKFPGNNENSSRSWERTGLVLPDTGITADESVPVYKDGFAFGDNMGFYG